MIQRHLISGMNDTELFLGPMEYIKKDTRERLMASLGEAVHKEIEEIGRVWYWPVNSDQDPKITQMKSIMRMYENKRVLISEEEIHCS